MSLFDKLRIDANHESDPKVRRERLAKIEQMESEVQDLDRRWAAVQANLAESATARKRFFSWREFIYGLGAMAALFGSFYFNLPPAGWIIALLAVFFAMVGVHLLVLRSRLRKLERSA